MDKLVFMHMPKCAGRSIINLLKENYPNSIIMNNMPMLAMMTKDELEGYDLICGHINYKFVNMLDGFKYMTIMRDPVERAISQYNHFMTMETSVTEAEILRLHNYSFMDFVSTSNPNLSLWTNIYNVQLGDDASVVYNVREYLKRAIIALGELDFIGIYEQMGETISKLKARYHLKGELETIGKTSKKNKVAHVTTEEKIEARKHLIPDLILYSLAKKRFNEGGI